MEPVEPVVLQVRLGHPLLLAVQVRLEAPVPLE